MKNKSFKEFQDPKVLQKNDCDKTANLLLQSKAIFWPTVVHSFCQNMNDEIET